MPWCDLIIARARALAIYGRGGAESATIDELHQLRDQIAEIGCNAALPALDAALADG